MCIRDRCCTVIGFYITDQSFGMEASAAGNPPQAPERLKAVSYTHLQAEHDKLASAILLTPSQEIAEKTKEELERQIRSLSRKRCV